MVIKFEIAKQGTGISPGNYIGKFKFQIGRRDVFSIQTEKGDDTGFQSSPGVLKCLRSRGWLKNLQFIEE